MLVLCVWPMPPLLQVRAAELAAMQRMEAAEKRKFEEKERRLAQARAHAAAERALRKKVAAATFARSYLQGEGTLNPKPAPASPLREDCCVALQRSGLQRKILGNNGAAGGSPAAGETTFACLSAKTYFTRHCAHPAGMMAGVRGHLPLSCCLEISHKAPCTSCRPDGQRAGPPVRVRLLLRPRGA